MNKRLENRRLFNYCVAYICWISLRSTQPTATSRLICWVLKISFSPLTPKLGGNQPIILA